MKIINLFLVLLIPGMIYAADSTGLTRSAGKLVNDSSIELTDKLSGSPVFESEQSKNREYENTVGPVATHSLRSANHGISVEFEIFDAWVELTGDIDDDGFYHHIRTTFDADVNTPVETVYAKLYLSYEGGPWRQVADSDLFEIHYDSIDDTYEIVSELIEGYPPGYYDVLIELHSFYHQGIVASRLITEDVDGYSISLEDLQHDERYREEETDYIETEHYVAAGSFSWAGLIMLGLLVLVKYRFFSKTRNSMPGG